jgi:hypothetical protein
MGYYRAKIKGNKQRRIAGYTRSDGTRVASYLRAKRRDIRKRRYVDA